MPFRNPMRLLPFMLALTVAGTATRDVAAQSVAQFYRGKTISLIVPFTTGGLNDLAGRLLAKYMPRYIPGEPTIVVQNEPSAGGLALANRFGHSVATDGTVIAAMGRALPQFQIMGDPNAHFDPASFIWLGSVSSFRNDASLLVLNASASPKNVLDLKRPGTPTPIGANRIGSTNMTLALIAKNVLGLNVQIVQGFPGTNDISLAMQRHEVEGQVMDLSYILSSQRGAWQSKQLRPILQFARVTRLDELPDIPTAQELATNDSDRALIEFAELPFFMAAPFAAPPGVPADRAQALQSAFAQVTTDPAFLADAKTAGIDISPIAGSAISQLIVKAGRTPKDVLARFKTLVGE